ncbi:hypothetical protein WL05_29005 [Burkholderia ubonensis]|uniref:Baseplate protein J-like domain-containing protein n=1 Tax=Burkholderia ubonensis TaxID=101571 RepID=A0ABD4E2E9_9BURK|nr:hypothetical protein [Burkholderia ubonensis]KVM16989.1 hypothetical protein WJ52_12930 [Burkholderia ubonensis]KVM18823.1 hypothetical protein WJ51_07155 [Burkholderia ubonensis]KVM42241.1 hypothetical protein WJ56_30635 [Burkholderia ubonensis]KVN85809.1 hypothetical protein WJ68_12430 [Burkholderia ubonensis]KVO09271.1 hypothetical protein WJ72_21205 [Burkholderia ubonensis]
MTFELPNLDTTTYDELVASLVRRIPQYTDLWTDYNATDPGITFVQLLAWLDESLLYQANQIPTLTDENFLRWVLGLAFSSNETAYSKAAVTDYDFAFLALQAALAKLEQGAPATKASLQRQVLAFRDAPCLALTLADVEALAMQANGMIEAEYEQQVQQQQASHSSVPVPVPLYVQAAYAQTRGEASIAHILDDAPWQYQYPAYPNRQQYANATDTMRRLLLLQPQAASDKAATLLRQVAYYLQPRVLAGNALRVAPAQLTPIDLAIAIQCAPDANLSITLDALVTALYRYLLPAQGPGGRGWRYGQAPNPDDLMHLVLGVPGVTALDAFDLTYLPTIALDEMAQLGATTLLAALPNGRTAMRYAGLPQLRCLDITATNRAPGTR